MRVGAAFVQTLSIQVIQSLASITTGVLIARGLGPAGQGRYATFAAGIAIGALLASLGQFHGNVLAAAHRDATPRVLLARAALHGCVVLAIVSVIVLLGRHILGNEHTVTLGLLFALVLSLEAVAEMVRGINLGQHHVTGWNVASLTQRLVYFVAIGLLALATGMRLESIMICWATATLVSVLVSGGWIWWRVPSEGFTLGSIWKGWSARIGQGMRAFVTIGLTLLLVRADTWMLGPMLGLSTVGQMSVATYLAEWMWYVPSILGNLLFAVVAADRGTRSVNQVTRSSRLIVSLLGSVMVVSIIAGRQLVHLLYGTAYHQAGLLFTLLAPGMTALGIHLVVDSYFAGSGFPPVTIWGATAALISKISLNLVIVPLFGAAGAAVVTSVVYVGLLGLKVLWFIRTTGSRWRDLFILNQSDVAYLKNRIQAFARP